MSRGKLLEKIDCRIAAAEDQFEAEKRTLLPCANGAKEVDAVRAYLKRLEQKLADLHELRVSLAGDPAGE